MRFEGDVLEDRHKETKQFSGRKKERFHLLVGIGVAILAVILALVFVFGVTTVSGVSMEPNYHDQQRVVYLKIGSYNYGDVVGINMTNGTGYIKRVVGLPGDVMEVRDGSVYRNGVKLVEDYAQGTTYPETGIVEYPYTVPENSCFVLGDNREHSEDSRSFGAIAWRQIVGKVISSGS